MLLGVDAVREFNVLRDSYGAEFGKRPGGQVVIVTQSGTNQWHGTAFEFLRNNVLELRISSTGGCSAVSTEPVGASMGGPVRKDIRFSSEITKDSGRACTRLPQRSFRSYFSRQRGSSVQPLLNLLAHAQRERP